MDLEQLRAIVAQLRTLIINLINKGQSVDQLLSDVNTIIAPESPAATSLDIDRFVGNYAPLFEERMILLAVAMRDLGGLSFIPFTITSTANEGGTITPSGQVYVLSGRTQDFTITPNDGASIQDVLVDGVSVGAVTSYQFTNVVANHTIEARFGR